MFNRGHRALLHAISSAILFLASLVPALAAGTIPFSMTQQLDQYGVPLSGCQLYTIQAGTTSTPQNAYKDTALTLVQPNPMVCDASGRLPQFFLADGQIKIRLLDKLGNPQVTLDNILVIGPSSGGGAGATIDSTTIAQTGDLKQSYGTQTIAGWVRLNGRTIGNAVSGATERANADTQALFLYLWAADSLLAVSGGRTTAAADYAANKTIALPDGRGRTLAGLDDMGNTAAGRLTAGYFGALTGYNGVTLGAVGGGESQTLSVGNIAPFTPSIASNATYNFNQAATSITFNAGPGGQTIMQTISQTPTAATLVTGATLNTLGSNTPHSIMQPTMLLTIYIKL